jgi:Bacterial regulatory proteins, lacI family
MADVARVAGVSHQTVSRVINDADHVRPETRERVLRAMVELDYRPNPVARALVTGRSRTLGVVSFDWCGTARCSQTVRAPDHVQHDLVGAGADPVQAQVAPHALDPVLLHVAGAAVDLQALVGDLAGDP